MKIVWLSYKEDTPARGYWDHGMIESLFSGELWSPACMPEFEHVSSIKDVPAGEGAIVVFPARAQTEFAEQLNTDLQQLQWVVLMLTGDEEASFDWGKLHHPNMKMWIMSPRQDRTYPKNTYFLGTGFPPAARTELPKHQEESRERAYDWFFAGQITHERRKEMAEQLNVLLENEQMKGYFLPTDGFTKGFKPEAYYSMMTSTKVAPCPSGPETPDSFRLFEALEAGCIPIADTLDPKGNFNDQYWNFFFGEEPPFSSITNYEQLPGYIVDALNDWRAKSNRIFAWWQMKKRNMARSLRDDVFNDNPLYEMKNMRDMITVLIPSSPIQAHPDTSMIEKTIADVRSRLPKSEILIMLDGVREEQKDMTDNYEQYKQRLLWLCNNQWSNVLPIIFDKHMHQASMTRETLKLVDTPMILFVEHDAPITPDFEFPWSEFVESIFYGDANLIRFHHEALVLPEHEPLMLPRRNDKPPMRATMQWSQRPHIASTAFYRHFIDTYFNPKSKTMIEDVMHGIVITECQRDGLLGWNNWRLWIYTPEGNIKRSYHLDGRGSDPKFEMDIKPVERA